MPLTVRPKFPSVAALAALTAAVAPLAGTAAAQSYNPPPRAVADMSAQPASGETTPAQAVSMRAGPNTGMPVIGTLRPGMSLQILATANHGWMQVQSPVGTGWVYGSYLASGVGGAMPAAADGSMPATAYGNPPPSPGANQPTPARRNPAAPEITSP